MVLRAATTRVTALVLEAGRAARRGSGAEAPLALGSVLLVLLVLAADLNEDVDEDHVHDDADAAERDEQSEGLNNRPAECEHCAPLGRLVSGRLARRVAFHPAHARRGAGAVERARLEIA